MKRPCPILLPVVMVIATQAHALDQPPLRLVQTIPLPGVEGRIDHMAADTTGHRLFVAALGNNSLEVIDLSAGKQTRSIAGLHEPQGVSFLPETNQIVVANGDGGACDIFDGDSFRLIQSVKFSDDADNVRYDPTTRCIYVGYGDGALGVIDGMSGEILGSVWLASHPESFQLEGSGSRIFVNVPSAGHIAVVDRKMRTVVATWPLPSVKANFPMALDEANHHLFVGCRKSPRVLVYDTESGKIVAGLDIAGDTDDLFYDAARNRLYVSCGEGVIDVFQQEGIDRYRVIAKIPTAGGARTSFFVPGQGRLYLAVPHRGSQKAEIRVYEVAP